MRYIHLTVLVPASCCNVLRFSCSASPECCCCSSGKIYSSTVNRPTCNSCSIQQSNIELLIRLACIWNVKIHEIVALGLPLKTQLTWLVGSGPRCRESSQFPSHLHPSRFFRTNCCHLDMGAWHLTRPCGSVDFVSTRENCFPPAMRFDLRIFLFESLVVYECPPFDLRQDPCRYSN